ncbi:hypothetical protein THASP1DRAFT_25225 [Thamnocephalis sphaerospora]|uniref:Galactose oxidase n=1 Tax=Thamnocephalis sphaerospora TaxID=78915 RepID=A0A4P9XL08_9FUNG|nr:hypothetical protein THASP1DRAFT_25225 [Thamnocephalis sphaerospora]|eukprot:RKP06465.1 hypothetical protein THASP1DRAFT_25225 [Thamnocephalis sphaerospora]
MTRFPELQTLFCTGLLLAGLARAAVANVTAGPRWGHSATLLGHNLYVIGGIQSSNAASKYIRNDSFVYSLDTTQAFHTDSPPWTAMEANGELPSGTGNHIAADAQSHIVIYGGSTDNPSQQDFLWSLDPTLRTWSRKPSVGGPAARLYYTTSATIGSNTYIFGGASSSLTMGGNVSTVFYDNLYKFDQSKLQWSELARAPGDSANRSQHTLSYVPAKKMLVAIGGMAGSSLAPTDSVLSFDIASNQWKEIKVAGEAPSPRRTHTAVVSGDHVIVFGGCDMSVQELYNDVVVLDTTTMSWLRPKVKNAPTGRCGHTASMVGDYMLVTFGFMGTGGDNRIYALNTKTWEFVTDYPGVSAGSSGLSVWQVLGISIGATIVLGIIIGFVSLQRARSRRKHNDLQIRLAAAAKLDASQAAYRNRWFRRGTQSASITFPPTRSSRYQGSMTSAATSSTPASHNYARIFSGSEGQQTPRQFSVDTVDSGAANLAAYEYTPTPSPLQRSVSPLQRPLSPPHILPRSHTPSVSSRVSSRAYAKHRQQSRPGTPLAAECPRSMTPQPHLPAETQPNSSVIGLTSIIIPDGWPAVGDYVTSAEQSFETAIEEAHVHRVAQEPVRYEPVRAATPGRTTSPNGALHVTNPEQGHNDNR